MRVPAATLGSGAAPDRRPGSGAGLGGAGWVCGGKAAAFLWGEERTETAFNDILDGRQLLRSEGAVNRSVRRTPFILGCHGSSSWGRDQAGWRRSNRNWRSSYLCGARLGSENTREWLVEGTNDSYEDYPLGVLATALDRAVMRLVR